MKRRPQKYKQYLSDFSKEIPESTQRSRHTADIKSKRLKLNASECESDGGSDTLENETCDYTNATCSTSLHSNTVDATSPEILHTDNVSAYSSIEHHLYDTSDGQSICTSDTVRCDQTKQNEDEMSFTLHQEFSSEYCADLLAENQAGRPQLDNQLPIPQRIEESLFDNSQFDAERPVYNGADLRKGQLLALIVAHSLKHGLSSAGLTDLLEIFNLVAPGSVPKTKWFMDKVFFNLSVKPQLHYYCSNCVKYVGVAVLDQCTNCGLILNEKKLLTDNCFFLVMPLSTQITSILQDETCQGKLRQHFRTDDHISDVNTGRMYKNKGRFIANPSNLTMSFNCDGAPVFKSSKYSIWPILCSINELPLHERKENIMLHTLWFGPHKPHIDTYMTPFVTELKKLHTDGLTWFDNANQQQLTKVHALVCVCDAPARAMVQKFTQFNGAYGCGFCLSEGQMVQKGNGHTRVYPLVYPQPPLRTMEETIQHAEAALANGVPEMGVKGASPLLLLPGFDLVKGFVPDYMHSVCLGVVRQFTNLWFDSSTSEEAFHLRARHLSLADEILKNIQAPNEVKRNPRHLSERKFWKASEWRAFLLFYSPIILKTMLPRQLYRHWMLLACAMHKLLMSDVTNMQIDIAERCLIKFVGQVGELYGAKYVSYNVHLLTHLAQSVRDHGLLWANSAFVYEDTNGTLLELFHGTQAVPRQIFKYFFARRKLLKHSSSIFVNASEQAKHIFQKMTVSNPSSSTATHISSDVVTVGKSTHRILSVRERVALQNTQHLLQHIVLPQAADVHSVSKRCIISNKLYTTSDYGTEFLRDNSVIYTALCYGLIKSLVKIQSQCHCQYQCNCSELIVFFHKLNILPNQHNMWCQDVGHNVSDFLVYVEESAQVSACRAKDVVGKCIYLKQDEFQCLIKMPTFELD